MSKFASYFIFDVSQETRYTAYVKTIDEIDDLMNQLEISQVSNFEKIALDKNNEFQLSEKNMQLLQVI